MARNEEKAQQMLNKWVTMKQEFNAGNIAERRPFLATDCKSLADCEKWRLQIMREITRKVAEIQNAGLGEHKIRDLNDTINKLLREEGHWQFRIRDLGGPDYNALEPKALDAEGRPLPGGGGYKYFGAARDLPGVKELFEAPPPVKKRRTRGDMFKHVTPDYYGFRDDNDPSLAAKEAVVEEATVAKLRAAELAAKEARRARRARDGDDASSSDDDPDAEAALLGAIDDQADAAVAKFEGDAAARLQFDKDVDAARRGASLTSKKRDLLDLLDDDGAGDDDDGVDALDAAVEGGYDAEATAPAEAA